MPRPHVNGGDQDGSALEKRNMAGVPDTDPSPSHGLDCNICLEDAQDPVVTLCGHLYCWPCIYTWLHSQPPSKASDQNQAQEDHHHGQQCPVCKSEVTPTTVVPLYGRGKTSKLSQGKDIPRRPSGPSCTIGALQLLTTTESSTGRPGSTPHLRREYLYQSPQPYPSQPSGYESPVMEGSHPFSEMFGEVMYARMFGSSVTNLSSGRNSYHLAGSSSPRLRRQLVRADMSMGRICFFLCCCVLACLLLF